MESGDGRNGEKDCAVRVLCMDMDGEDMRMKEKRLRLTSCSRG